MIVTDSIAYQRNDEVCHFFKNALLKENLSLETLDLYDERYSLLKENLPSYNVAFHIFTQNQYFQGIVIGINAGSMNSAKTVYVQPKEPGKSIDSHFKR